ncbi:MAG: ABC transporter permease subunit [Meiothermus sp.]|nr:ABC transporter permease subunit [Meiothermus sp.]
MVGFLLALPPMVVLFFLILLPAFEAVKFSLGLVPEDNVAYASGLNVIRSNGPTLEVFEKLFASPFFQQNVRLTFFVSIVSVLILLVVAYVLALYARFGKGRLPSIIRTLYLVPMFIPTIIASYALIVFFGDNGLLEALLSRFGVPYQTIIRQDWGIIMGQVWASIPFAVLMLSSGLDAISDDHIEAAKDCGASFATILWRILIPLNIVPALIVATFTFIGVFGSFTVPYMLGPTVPQMLGVSMQVNFTAFRQPQTAVAIAVFSFAVCAVAGYIYVVATTRQNRSQQ